MAGIVVPIDGDIGPLLAEFGKLPGRTQQEMDAVGRVIDAEITRGRVAKSFAELPGVSQKQAKKAANMLAREIDKGARAAEQSLVKMRQGAGAVFGGIVNDIDDVGGALASLGPAGMAAGTALAGVAVVAGTAWAEFKLYQQLASWLFDAATATGELDDEQKTLAATLAGIQQNVGEQAVPSFEALYDVTGAVTLAFKNFTDSRPDVIFLALDQVFQGLPSRLQQIHDSMDDGALSRFQFIQDWKDAKKELAEMAKYQNQGPTLDMLGGGPKQEQATRTKVKAATEHTSALDKEIEALKARDEWMEKAVELDNMEAEALKGLDEQIQTNAKDIAAAQAQQQQQTQEQADLELAAKEAMINAYANWAGAIEMVSGTLAEQEGISKSAATALVIVSKAAAIAQIGIDTAVAVMGAVAAFAAVPPVAAAVASGYIAMGVAQAAVVAATPESFHTGGIVAPDERLINARPGEGVLTAQGVSAAGGASGVAAMNRGDAGDRPIVVVQQYQHRVFDEFVADNISRSGSPLGRALRKGERVGRRGRG